jgi:hypothetical protein
LAVSRAALGKNPNEVRIRELMARHQDRHQRGAEHLVRIG